MKSARDRSQDLMLPEGGRDDGRALEAVGYIAPGLEIDVLNLLAVDLLADEVEETVLIVDIDREVGETGLRDQVHDGQLAGGACIVQVLEEARDGDVGQHRSTSATGATSQPARYSSYARGAGCRQ